MNYLTLLPVWDKLDEKQQDLLINTSSVHKFHKGNLLHSGSADCMGQVIHALLTRPPLSHQIVIPKKS